MSALQAVIHELAHYTPDWGTARIAHKGKGPARTAADVQCSAICARLRNLGPVDADAKNSLFDASIKGPWNQAQQKILANAIVAMPNYQGRKPRRDYQKCNHFEQFQTEQEWTGLGLGNATFASI